WALHELAVGRQSRGQFQEEEEAYHQELAASDKLAQAFPTVSRYRNKVLATKQDLAELLWSTDRRAEASQLCHQIRDGMDRVSPEDGAGHATRAWFLAFCPDPQLRDARRAVELAMRATALAPGEREYWTTLGAAQYRAGSWPEAAEALSHGQQPAESS